MGFFNHLCNGMEKIISVFSAFLVVILTGFVGIEVAGRYLFSKSFGFVEESTSWMMVWFSFLSAGVLLRRNQHVVVDILERWLSPRTHKIMKIVGLLATMATGAWFFWAGVLACRNAYLSRETTITFLSVPQYLIRLALPIGMLVLIIFCIESILKTVVPLRSTSE